MRLMGPTLALAPWRFVLPPRVASRQVGVIRRQALALVGSAFHGDNLLVLCLTALNKEVARASLRYDSGDGVGAIG